MRDMTQKQASDDAPAALPPRPPSARTHRCWLLHQLAQHRQDGLASWDSWARCFGFLGVGCCEVYSKLVDRFMSRQLAVMVVVVVVKAHAARQQGHVRLHICTAVERKGKKKKEQEADGDAVRTA